MDDYREKEWYELMTGHFNGTAPKWFEEEYKILSTKVAEEMNKRRLPYHDQMTRFISYRIYVERASIFEAFDEIEEDIRKHAPPL